MTDNSGIETVRTVCGECRMMCGMLVRVKNGRAIRVESDPGSPKTRDNLCWRAQAGLERLYHPDRLHYPLMRTGVRGEGKWKRITWDEAEGIIAEKLNGFKAEHGPESVAFIKGQYDRRCDLVSRMGNAFGTPNIAGIDNTCYIPSASGRLMTYGYDGRPDFSGSPDCVMSWGSSLDVPLKKGGKLIVVNTFKTEAAKKADIWLQPRPASDLALALGMISVIVSERLYDKDFVEKWTTGFDRLEKHIQKYTPEKVAKITWVPAESIVEAARLFAGHKYACLQNGNGSEDTYNSTQFARALSIIQAICGLLDIPGGTLLAPSGPVDREGKGSDVLSHIITHEREKKKLGFEHGHYPTDTLWEPIANKPAELQSQYLIQAMLDETPYKIYGTLVMGCNPVMTWCNSRRVYEALKKVNFLAVADLFMTPTASLADIVLPSASYLESDAVQLGSLGNGDTFLIAQQKAVQVGECKPDLEIIISLANRLGLGSYFWKDFASYLDDYTGKIGLTFDELRRRHVVVSSGEKYRKYLEKGFNTPSGKVEIYSSLCEKWGYEALPEYHEPKETPYSSPEMVEEYPLILTSTHGRDYVHSQDRQLDILRKRKPEPLVLIHPDTAFDLGIHEGDRVYIENRRGRIEQTASLSDGIDPRVVCVDYGWWFPERGAPAQYGWDEANINMLTDDSPPYSPEIGSPSMRGFLCRIYKAD
ncbi:MAG: molybdopterin-dependent oxidoreductase [Deltaproteobacteria bacterium]|nr:molybdopterin-dependent oxidoreductase [Deltaproteobacteria bacterium]